MNQLTLNEKWMIYHDACDWIRPVVNGVHDDERVYKVNTFKKRYRINTEDANLLINKLIEVGKLVKIDEGTYEAIRKCTMCGKEFDYWDRVENHYIYYDFGYGSKYDKDELEADLCCDCYDKVVDFIKSKSKINPIIQEGSRPKEPF